MNKTLTFLVLALLTGFLLSACGASANAIATGVAQTLEISDLKTAAAGGGAAAPTQPPPPTAEPAAPEPSATDLPPAAPTATFTLVPADTLVPTATFTFTPDIPMVSVTRDTNCRTGPALTYGHVITAKPGETYEVVGLPSDPKLDDYVIVNRLDKVGTCWLWTRYADKTDFSAYSSLQKYNTPATSTPTFTATPSFNWAATWSSWVGDPGSYSNYSMTLNVSGSSVSGSFSYGGGTVTLTGTITSDGQRVSGSFTDSGGPPGTFQWRIKSGNINQFQGTIVGGSTADWCGAKSGASRPSPCRWP